VTPSIPQWPDNKKFAFTIFDDPDSQTFECAQTVYGFLHDHGLYTTKGVWPLAPRREASDHGATCGDSAFRAWLQKLQASGFEMGYHNATSHTSTRAETLHGLNLFREYFGHDPHSMSSHYASREAIYLGDARLGGWRRKVYQLATRGGRSGTLGHVPDQEYFWGDLCRERIHYVRNFVFRNINTLAECPFMPYHDPSRPYVNAWYASSEGANIRSCLDMLTESNQDQLEAEGGACILYVHFGHGFTDEKGRLVPRFVELIRRLSRKNGWFVPVSTLLKHLHGSPAPTISSRDLAKLERRWLLQKLMYGTS
jgi:hypothetical protein